MVLCMQSVRYWFFIIMFGCRSYRHARYSFGQVTHAHICFRNIVECIGLRFHIHHSNISSIALFRQYEMVVVIGRAQASVPNFPLAWRLWTRWCATHRRWCGQFRAFCWRWCGRRCCGWRNNGPCLLSTIQFGVQIDRTMNWTSNWTFGCIFRQTWLMLRCRRIVVFAQQILLVNPTQCVWHLFWHLETFTSKRKRR